MRPTAHDSIGVQCPKTNMYTHDAIPFPLVIRLDIARCTFSSVAIVLRILLK